MAQGDQKLLQVILNNYPDAQETCKRQAELFSQRPQILEREKQWDSIPTILKELDREYSLASPSGTNIDIEPSQLRSTSYVLVLELLRADS